MIIETSELTDITVNRFKYNINFDDVPLIDRILIDNNLFGRLDIVIINYYNGDMNLLPLLMDFNDINDVTKMNIGQILNLPDMNFLLDNLEIIDDIDDIEVAGIIQSDFNIKTSEQSTNSDTTTASPKLNINLKNVFYNEKTGELIL